jgi:hypothetical protein
VRRRSLPSTPRTRQLTVVITDVSAVADIEITALDVLSRFAADLPVRGLETWLVGMVLDEREMFERYGIVRSCVSSPRAVTAFISAGEQLDGP